MIANAINQPKAMAFEEGLKISRYVIGLLNQPLPSHHIYLFIGD